MRNEGVCKQNISRPNRHRNDETVAECELNYFL